MSYVQISLPKKPHYLLHILFLVGVCFFLVQRIKSSRWQLKKKKRKKSMKLLNGSCILKMRLKGSQPSKFIVYRKFTMKQD